MNAVPTWIVAHAEGSLLALRAAPGASRERVVGPHGAALKIAVAAPPEGGKANASITALLARVLEVSRGSIVLVSGTSSRDKKVLVRGLEPAIVARRLADLLDD